MVIYFGHNYESENMEINVLNAGYVKLISSMGNDSTIDSCARVSYNAHEKPRTKEEITKLNRYLLKNNHTSPFEMVEFMFEVKAPIFIARQWMRHRTASINEISYRYSRFDGDYYIPERLKTQSESNKQCSGGYLDDKPGGARLNKEFTEEIKRCNDTALKLYYDMIESGVSREIARMHLPLSIYTKFIWKIDLKNLLHFISLRNHPHAQYEIQLYAQAIESIVKEVVPITYENWEFIRLPDEKCFT